MQKGAKAKALKEYQLLLQADPRDAKLLLEVGDAYRRWGQTEDAIAQYAKVAQQYRQDGFDARAVAVYKQILNLDPKHYAAYVSLSELYQRMGLDSEAIGALQTAADGYHREGRKSDALELLRQMAALDPTNTTSRLKVAELLRQEKMTAEALAEYEAAARELENQQDRDQLVAVRGRILELKPDHQGALTGMVRTLMLAGQLDRAEPFALRAVQASGEPAQYELLIELFAQMGNDAKLAEATRALAKVHRDRGDEDKARELMQRLPADEVGARSRLAVDVSEVDEPELDDDELLDDDPFVTVSGARSPSVSSLGGDELELDDEEAIELEAPKATARPTVASLEGDPDQLLAEASVYLRYGKRGQAIDSLRRVLEQDPNHRGALEKLGEAYVDDGRPSEAVPLWLRAAEQIERAGDTQALAVLRDRIASLDPQAAAKLAPARSPARGMAGARPAAAEAAISIPELDLDLEVDLDEELDDATGPARDEAALDSDESELGFEVELDPDALDLASDPKESSAADAEEGETTTPSLELSDDGSFEFEIDPDEISGEGADQTDALSDGPFGPALDLESGSAAAFEDAAATSARPGTTTTTARIQEELEEAEFYIAQEMFDEAESILARILELAPNHPSAMLRMGEIQVARGASPESAASTHELPTKLGHRAAEEGLALEVDVEVDLDLDLAGDVADGFADESGAAMDSSSGPSAAEALPSIPVATPALATSSALEAQSEPAMALDADEPFDLREALADVFNDSGEGDRERRASTVLSTVEDGFESIFSDFKKGVSATLDEGDYDTRYDLGIAYREMGLYEDAIGEFKLCLESPNRRFDSLYLMGLCARDLSRYGDAVHHLEQALALPDLPGDRLAGVFFDLAVAQALAGDRERACVNMRRVLELDSSFPNAAEKLAEFEAPVPLTPRAAAEAPTATAAERFESFDDLFAEEPTLEATPVEESFESFDDVVSDVITTTPDPAPAAIPESEPVPAPPPAADPNAQSSRKSGRKKISFV